jgi:uncharacterized membrane protein YkvI
MQKWIQERLSSHSKGFAGNLSGAVLGIGVAVMIAAFVALILGNVNSTFTADSYEDNISTTGLATLDDMSDLFQPLGLVVIAVVIIGVLMGAFKGIGGR